MTVPERIALSGVITLDGDQARLVRRTASLFGMELQGFLNSALESGIAHAQAIKRTELDDACLDEMGLPWPGPDSPDAYLPF